MVKISSLIYSYETTILRRGTALTNMSVFENGFLKIDATTTSCTYNTYSNIRYRTSSIYVFINAKNT